MKKNKKKMILCLTLSAVCFSVFALPTSVAASDQGGWTEENGYYTNTQRTSLNPVLPFHNGRTETKAIGGTTHKQAIGNTSWKNVYHYTRAKVEACSLFICSDATDSGRKWGTSYTSAYSGWAPYNKYDSLSGKTFYGK